MYNKKCEGCSKFADQVPLGDVEVTIGTRKCEPPFPYAKRVLSCVGCVRPDDPNFFSPQKSVQEPKQVAVLS